jgi:hypothetical protein
MIKKLWFITFIFLFMVAGCTALGPNKIVSTPTAAPAKGMAIFSGQVLNSQDGLPITDTPVRLAQVYRQGEQGAYVLDMSHSPSSVSDKSGNFSILDIAPAEYLIVIGKPEDNHYLIYQDDAGKPITYQLEADKSIQVGVIKVDFKP